MRKVMSEFLDIGEKSYYVWKNTSHIRLMTFLEKYLTRDDVQEYLDTDQILKFKLVKEFSDKEYLYNEKILEMLEIFNDYDDRSFNDYDYNRYDFDATSYIIQFIMYLSPKNDHFEINLNTYNEYLMLKHEEAILKIYNAKSSYHSALKTYEKEKESNSADEEESMIHFYQSELYDSELYLIAATDEKKVIESILKVTHEMIYTADRNILLQLEILKKYDFEPLLRQATKGEVNGFLRSFISQWISIKYDTDLIRTQKVIEDIANLRKINLQEVITTISEQPSKS